HRRAPRPLVSLARRRGPGSVDPRRRARGGPPRRRPRAACRSAARAPLRRRGRRPERPRTRDPRARAAAVARVGPARREAGRPWMTSALAARPLARARSIMTAPSMRRIRAGGAEARYLIAGSGPPVLVVASPLVLARTYARMARLLAASFTVVVIEPPGSGGSQRLDRAWSFE